MSGIPLLNPVTNTTLVKPTFTEAISKNREDWVAENSPSLLLWFQATKEYAPDDETWDSYCAEQYFQQQGKDQNVEAWAS